MRKIINSTYITLAKYVVSSTLTDPEWNNTSVISGDPLPEIERLKQAPGKEGHPEAA
jgi:hypothetical protein